MPANQSTPEVTRADRERDALTLERFGFYSTAREVRNGAYDQNVATPARGGDELREALRASLAKRSQPAMDPPYTAAFNAALDMVARDVAPFLASTDMAGASVPDRLARRMGAEFIARDDVPQVEGLTSGDKCESVLSTLRILRRAVEETGIHHTEPSVKQAMEHATIVLGRGY